MRLTPKARSVPCVALACCAASHNRLDDSLCPSAGVSAEASLFTLADARFVVRYVAGQWSTGDRIRFNGHTWTVRGMAEIIGRERFLELVARRVGS